MTSVRFLIAVFFRQGHRRVPPSSLVGKRSQILAQFRLNRTMADNLMHEAVIVFKSILYFSMASLTQNINFINNFSNVF